MNYSHQSRKSTGLPGPNHGFQLRGGILLVVFVGMLLLGGLDGFGQLPMPRFESLTVDEGLSSNSIFAVFQDQRDFIWFGTDDGLNRYDGFEFEIFRNDPKDPRSLSSSFIWCVYRDSRDNLWVGTANGLNRMAGDGSGFQRYFAEQEQGLGNNRINVIFEDNQQNLWVGTHNGLSLYDVESDRFTLFQNDPEDERSLGGNRIHAIIQDHQGRIWIGGYGGLDLYHPETRDFTHFQHDPDNPNSLGDNRIRAILEDRDANLWIGTYGGGLFQFSPDLQSIKHFSANPDQPGSLSHDQILSLLQDNYGRIWIAAWNGGLNMLRPGSNKFEHFGHNPLNPDSLPSESVVCLAEDRTGIIWIGTWLGVSKWNPLTMNFGHVEQTPGDPKSLNNNLVNFFCEDPDGTIWILTINGLNRWNRTTGENEIIVDESLSEKAYSLFFDKGGAMWIGSRNGLLRRSARGTGFESFPRNLSPEEAGNAVNFYRILEDQQGYLWASSYGGGVWRLSPDRMQAINYYSSEGSGNGLVTNEVNTIFEDRQGWIWLGTTLGLQRWDEESGSFSLWQHDPENPASLAHNEVFCIIEDKTGYLWIATPGGLCRFDRKSKRFRTYTTEDGLSPSSPMGLLEDDHGMIWISSARGLSMLDPASGRVRNFEKSHGLYSLPFNQGSMMKTRDGCLFFGGEKGFNHFNPDNIRHNTFVPKVSLSHFRKFNQRIELPLPLYLTENLDLSYKDSFFTFEFALLDFKDPKKNTYAYKMEGFNEDWVYSEGLNQATFTNLDPRDYSFRVKGANTDGIWSEPVQIALSISPPPWRTLYAYLFYLLLLALIVYSFLRSQRKKLAYERSVNERLRQIDRLKDEFLANTSHELRTPLNGIIGVTESLMDGAAGPINNQLAANLSMVVSSARRLSGLVDDILDFSKMKNKKLHLHKQPVSLCAVADQVMNLTAPLANGKELELYNEIPPDFPFVDADENRIHQILNNLVGNAIKFTETGAIRVSAQITEHQAVIHVQDTGIGIPADKMERIFESFEQVDGSTAREFGGTGLGLAITRQLVSQHGGKIWAISSIGKGSTFSFTLPLSGEDHVPEAAPNKGLARLRPLKEVPKSEPHPLPGPDNSQFHVLVVDDDPINRQVLVNHLSLRQYQVTQAVGGPEALALFEEGQVFDLVLLDVMMPRLSGYKVCKKLRETRPATELPILLLTAKDQVEDLVMGFRAGASDYLVKPIIKDELLSRITTHLGLLESTRGLENYKTHLEDMVKDRTTALEDRKREMEALDEIVQVINREIHFGTLAQTLLDQAMLLFPQADMGSLIVFNRNTLHFEIIASKKYDPALTRNIELSLEEVKGRYSNDHPMAEGIFLIKDTKTLPAEEKIVPILQSEVMLTMSLMRGSELEGFFVMDSVKSRDSFDGVDLVRLERFRQHAISAISKARFVEHLVETTDELKRAQQKLLNAAHQAGMAEIAINILHNIGNTLNSVKTSANIIIDHLTEPRAVRILDGVATLLGEHRDNLAAFFTEDQRGRALPDGLARVSQKIKDVYDKLRGETMQLIRGLEEIHQTLQMQQEHAGAPRLMEEVNINRLIREVMADQGPELAQSRIQYSIGDLDLPNIRIEKSKLAKVIKQVLLNARDALASKPEGEPRHLSINTSINSSWAQIEISDNGPGVAPELLERIFQHGYTTKPGSRGHGLHFCANALTEMGGRIQILSKGSGLGATCVIQLPYQS